MTKRFRKLLSILCALAMLTCVFPAFAEEENTETPSQPETPETAETVEAESPGEEDSSGTQQAVVEDLEDLPETDPEPPVEPEEEQPEELPEEPSEEIVSDAMTIEEAVEAEQKEEEEQPEEPSEEPAEVPEAVEPAPPAEEPEKTVDVQENNPPADEAAPPKDEPVEDKQEENEPESKPEEQPEEPEAEPEEEPDEESEEILLNLNGQTSISGELTRETPFTFTTSDDYFRTVVFTLTVPEEDSVSVTLNDNPIALKKIENTDPDPEEVQYTFERTLAQNQIYTITLTTDRENKIPFTVTISEKTEEEPAEETAETTETSKEEAEKEAETDSGLEENKQEEDEQDEEIISERDTSVNIAISFGEKGCRIGYPVYFTADLSKYEGMSYTLQWQFSEDNENWADIEMENDQVLEIILTEENRLYYWRVAVDVSDR